jgi:alcohol dehydrogenase
MSGFTSFDHNPRTRIVFGEGAADRVGELARQIGLKRVLLVTDPGILAAGHAERVRQSLGESKIQTLLFASVHENPTTTDVDACVAVARDGIDGIVGLGGGSSMDTAKGCNFVLTNGGRMQDYWGLGKASRPMLPLIAIPTTAGTGSECQSFALIADAGTHQKMACGDPKAAARIAILDPVLTVSQPLRVTACTGIDALSHALETAVTRKRNVLSVSYSRESFHLCHGNLGRVLKNGGDLEARAGMLLGAAVAGLAIENSMLGAAHAAANPLTAQFQVVHGHAVGVMLPAVIRFNAADADTARVYEELSPGLAEKIVELLNLAGVPRSLADCGVPRSAIPALACEAAKQWTASFNPRQAGEEDFVKLYESAFEARR